jgi:hypothetical protein
MGAARCEILRAVIMKICLKWNRRTLSYHEDAGGTLVNVYRIERRHISEETHHPGGYD